MLISGIAIIAGILNHNMIENHLVTRLYKLKQKQRPQPSPDTQSGENPSNNHTELTKMTPRSTQNFIEYLRDTVIGCKYCFKSCKSRHHFYDRFEVGRQKLQKETNIVEIVKKLRFYEAIISTLTTQPQRAHLKAKSRYKCIRFD